MSGLTKEDIAVARKIFESKGVGDMYDYMAMKGADMPCLPMALLKATP